MFSKYKINWNLLAKYMAGETNTKENTDVETWANNNAGNRELLREIKTDWKKMDMMDTRFDVDNAWNKVQNRILTDSAPEVHQSAVNYKKPVLRYMRTPMRIAASLALLAMLGIALVTVAGRLQRVNITASQTEKGKVVQLPDGTSVYLNADTRLSYTKRFAKNHRDVILDGEAFFEVTHDKSRPFRIYAGNACVKVLGTSFNVNTRKNNNQVEVYVSTGVVELSEVADQNNRVLLHPGNTGTIEQKKIQFTSTGSENCIAWKTGDLNFKDTRLQDVIPVLNDVYQVKIILNEPEIDTTRIDGSYHGDPLDQILRVICKQNPKLKVAKSGDTIYLSR